MENDHILLQFIPTDDEVQVFKGNQLYGYIDDDYFIPSLVAELSIEDLNRIERYMKLQQEKSSLEQSLTEDFSDALEALGPEIKNLSIFSWRTKCRKN